MHRPARLTMLLAILAAVALLLAACADEADDAEEADEPDPDVEDVDEDPEDDVDVDEEAEDEEADDAEEAAEVEERSLTFAYITPETFPYHDGALRFQELVEESSGGNITVELFPEAQLGDEREINESILEGTIDVGIGAGALASFAPIMNLPQLPFIVANQDHMHAIIEDEAGERIAEEVEEAGFKVLDWFSTGDSSIQTVDVPISSPSDLEGLRIRAIENDAIVDALEALGANPTPMPFPEVYTGLEQGVVEGAHLDWGSVAANQIYEQIDYATSPDVAFLAEPRPVIMSMDAWESFDSATQDLIQEAMSEAAQYERDLFVDTIDDAVDQVADAGVEFTDIDEQEFLDIVEPVWEQWAEELGAEDVLERFNELRP